MGSVSVSDPRHSPGGAHTIQGVSLEPSEKALDPHRATAVEGRVVHFLFSDEESGFCVARLAAPDGARFTAVGILLGIRVGDELRLAGRWVDHPRFGEQLQVDSFVTSDPKTLHGMRKFLGSGRIRGLGPTMAARIVDAFGLDTLEVLDNHPKRLLQVKGIGRSTLEKIRAAWQEQRGLQRVMVFLGGHGVGPGIALRVHRRFGASAVDAVRDNPYRLAEEVSGVGFLTADRIARSLGVEADDPQRISAGLLYALERAGDDGHVFLPRSRLVATAAGLLEVAEETLGPVVDGLGRRESVVLRPRSPDGEDDPAVYLPWMERAERTVARRIRDLLAVPAGGPEVHVARALRWFEGRTGLSLAASQRRALEQGLTAKVVVVTGGPGTGKTTLVRGLTDILAAKDAQVLLAAPTGRAAKRLAEATGQESRTVHRLLEFNPGTRTFTRCREHPLEADLVVVDESSMLDVELAASLLDAVPPAARLVLVGDADQLPSVGPGNVLADLIASGAAPVVRLDEVFRQAARSLIVRNAHRVNRGEMPLLPQGDDLHDFYVIDRDDPNEAADLVVDLAARRIPARFGLDPITDLQVIAPMHRGELGVASLNERLQTVLTPAGAELSFGARSFRVGDKVMQVRNNYDLDLFNGDIGRVVSIDREERELVAVFDGRSVLIPHDALDDLVVAYACTIHKAQGSEYPAVVIALHHQHHLMLQRNLLYTAITRGRRLVVVVGSRRALRRAVRNATVHRRHTLLADRLREGNLQ